MLSRERNCEVNSFERNFKLQHDAVDGFQCLRGGFHIGWLQRVIRSLDYEDAVLSTGLDEGIPEQEAVRRANLYAGLSTTGVGTQKSFYDRERFDAEWKSQSGTGSV